MADKAYGTEPIINCINEEIKILDQIVQEKRLKTLVYNISNT